MRNVKKFLRGALAVMAVGAILGGSVAKAANPSKPRDANGIPYETLNFIGAKKCVVYPGAGGAGAGGFACPGTSTGGFVYAAYVFGSALVSNASVSLYDTATASDVSGLSWGASRLSPPIFGTTTPYGVNGGGGIAGFPWVPPVPARFDSQLVWARTDATAGVVILYRLDAGTNP